MKEVSELHAHVSRVKGEQLEQESTLEELKATLSEVTGHEEANKDQVEKLLSDLQADVSQMKCECTTHSMLDRMISEVSGKISQVEGKQHAALSELQKQGKETKDHLDKTVSQVQSSLALMKDEQESVLAELQGYREATTKHVNKQIFDLQAYLSSMDGACGELEGQCGIDKILVTPRN